MADTRDNDTADGDARSAHVTLTTDRITSDAADALSAALYAGGLAIERRAFLPTHDDVAHPWGVLLLAVAGPPLPLVQLVAPATTLTSVFSALVAALGIGHRPTPATLQLKARGVFVSVRAQNLEDFAAALDGLPAQLTRLDTRHPERRLVYADATWRIDP